MDKNDIQSLMKIAAKELKDPKKKANTDLEKIRDFVRLNEIVESDEHIVKFTMIYDRYESWCKISKLLPMTKIKFAKLFALIFNRVERQHVIYFSVSPKGFDFTAENQQRLKTNEKNANKKKSKI